MTSPSLFHKKSKSEGTAKPIPQGEPATGALAFGLAQCRQELYEGEMTQHQHLELARPNRVSKRP